MDTLQTNVPSLQARTHCSTSAAPPTPRPWCSAAETEPSYEPGEFADGSGAQVVVVEARNRGVKRELVDETPKSPLGKAAAAAAVPPPRAAAATAIAAVCTPATQGLGHDSAGEAVGRRSNAKQ